MKKIGFLPWRSCKWGDRYTTPSKYTDSSGLLGDVEAREGHATPKVIQGSCNYFITGNNIQCPFQLPRDQWSKRAVVVGITTVAHKPYTSFQCVGWTHMVAHSIHAMCSDGSDCLLCSFLHCSTQSKCRGLDGSSPRKIRSGPNLQNL